MKEICFGNIGESTPLDILESREDRVNYQQKLIRQYRTTLLCMRVNYPGVKKNNETTLNIMKILNEEVISKFKNSIIYGEFSITYEGPTLTVLINKKHNNVKAIAVQIEEKHPLGRCVDIDVYDKEYNSLSRRTMGIPSRTCYICSNDAQICVRTKKHKFHEIEKYIKDKYESYISYSKI